MVRPHHLVQVILGRLKDLLFRWDLLLRWHRVILMGQPHHLVQVILGRRMLRLLRLDPVIQMDPLPRLRREVLVRLMAPLFH